MITTKYANTVGNMYFYHPRGDTARPEIKYCSFRAKMFPESNVVGIRMFPGQNVFGVPDPKFQVPGSRFQIPGSKLPSSRLRWGLQPRFHPLRRCSVVETAWESKEIPAKQYGFHNIKESPCSGSGNWRPLFIYYLLPSHIYYFTFWIVWMIWNSVFTHFPMGALGPALSLSGNTVKTLIFLL